MAMITCPECGKKISDKSTMCIFCGCSMDFILKSTQQREYTIQELIDIADNYYFGEEGYKEDEAEALKWYLKAAERGDAYAQYSVGHCYRHGNGCEKNPTKAVEYLKKAAEQNHTEAQVELGVAFLDGRGIQKDEKQAFQWLLKASLEKDGEALYRLGTCFEHGYGVSADEDIALILYHAGAEEEDEEAEESEKRLLKKIQGREKPKPQTPTRITGTQNATRAQVGQQSNQPSSATKRTREEILAEIYRQNEKWKNEYISDEEQEESDNEERREIEEYETDYHDKIKSSEEKGWFYAEDDEDTDAQGYEEFNEEWYNRVDRRSDDDDDDDDYDVLGSIFDD